MYKFVQRFDTKESIIFIYFFTRISHSRNDFMIEIKNI